MLRFHMREQDGGDPTPQPDPQPDPTPTPEPQPDPSPVSGVSREEFDAVSQRLEQIQGIVPTVQQIAQYFQQPEENPDDLDIDEYVERLVESRIAPYRPHIEAASKRAGEENMKKLFSELEKKPEIGKFDHALAERVAESFYAQYGDPIKAVQEGARFAAEVRKREREEGIKEYQASLRRGPHDLDPDVRGTGNKTVPKAKTYDEVTERWEKAFGNPTHQDEV